LNDPLTVTYPTNAHTWAFAGSHFTAPLTPPSPRCPSHRTHLPLVYAHCRCHFPRHRIYTAWFSRLAGFSRAPHGTYSYSHHILHRSLVIASSCGHAYLTLLPSLPLLDSTTPLPPRAVPALPNTRHGCPHGPPGRCHLSTRRYLCTGLQFPHAPHVRLLVPLDTVRRGHCRRTGDWRVLYHASCTFYARGVDIPGTYLPVTCSTRHLQFHLHLRHSRFCVYYYLPLTPWFLGGDTFPHTP